MPPIAEKLPPLPGMESTQPAIPKATPGNDLGMADTGVQQSKTQPMEGAPKPPPQTPATPYSDEHLAAAKREFEAFKKLQDDPKSVEKQQAFQDAQRAADAHRIEATRTERNARVDAEKRYNEADAAFDSAKADYDKAQKSADPAARSQAEKRYQDAYDKLDRANDDYNKAHMKEVDAWAKAGGMRAPPKDVPASPAANAPLPATTRPMENPVAKPNAGVASSEGSMKSPKAGTLDNMPAKPNAAPPAPAGTRPMENPVARSPGADVAGARAGDYGGANATLAMGLSNLAGVIQKGP